MHITVYSPCPQALIYLPAALLSSSHYKINLYLGKRWRYLFLNFFNNVFGDLLQLSVLYYLFIVPMGCPTTW